MSLTGGSLTRKPPWRRTWTATLVVACVALPAVPVTATAQDDVLVRVVDVGAGLCTITRAPGADGPHYMVFDAGTEFPFNSDACFDAVDALVDGDRIDLMIISHPDADHVVDAARILAGFQVGRIVRTGHERNRVFWREFDAAVQAEAAAGATVTDLRDAPLQTGERIPLGDATVTLVAGWHDWLALERFDSGEDRNVISIVARLEFAGRSVLFTGDAIGRRKSDDDDTACKDAEEFMVANSRSVPIRSNVVIAPHHGGNNGSSRCFVETVFGPADDRVVPRFVVFSAGHDHAHPTLAAAERWHEFGGVDWLFMFRTDRGDDEASEFHWDSPDAPVPGCKDDAGDDAVDIVLRGDGIVEVGYRSDDVGPCND